jgi:hypothetical protein
LAQRHEQREEVAPFFREHVFLIRAAVRGRNGLQDVVVDQVLEPR